MKTENQLAPERRNLSDDLSEQQIEELRSDLYKYAKDELHTTEEQALHLARIFSVPVLHL